MLRKKYILGILTTAAAVGLPMAVVACSSQPTYFQSKINEAARAIRANTYDFGADNWDMSNINWNKVSHVDAEIVSWIDGDTPIVKFDKDFGNIKTTDTPHIRIAGIDTPELHIMGKDGKINILTSGKEYKWAEAGRVFGDSQMPKGTKIRIATTGFKSYDRVVGSLFYGKNYSKNYSIEIMKKGLAFPFFSSKLSEMFGGTSILNYIALPIADAYNLAKIKKIGIFGDDPATISKIHGATDVSKVDWEQHDIVRGSIYSIIETLGEK